MELQILTQWGLKCSSLDKNSSVRPRLRVRRSYFEKQKGNTAGSGELSGFWALPWSSPGPGLELHVVLQLSARVALLKLLSQIRLESRGPRFVLPPAGHSLTRLPQARGLWGMEFSVTPETACQGRWNPGTVLDSFLQPCRFTPQQTLRYPHFLSFNTGS